jgi:hypothetical protein
MEMIWATNQHNNRCTVGNAEFTKKGASMQRELEHGSRGIAFGGAVARQLLVKTPWSGKYLACALVICKM